jgi:ABC-type phosphonate transport system ATPase subunit
VKYIIIIIIDTTIGIVMELNLAVIIITTTMDAARMKDYQQQLIPHQ